MLVIPLILICTLQLNTHPVPSFISKIYLNETLIKTILNRNSFVVIRSTKVHGIWLLNISSVIFVRVSFAVNFLIYIQKVFVLSKNTAYHAI